MDTQDQVQLAEDQETVIGPFVRAFSLRTAWPLAAALALGTLYALIVPAGLPYDEPSHWSVVQHVASHWSLPVLGSPGVSYEAQQAPLFYLVSAPLSLLPHGFLIVRLFSVFGHTAFSLLIWLLLHQLLPKKPQIALLGTAFIALNPMLLAIAGSVQNDTWALVFGLSAVLIALRLDPSSFRTGVWVGLAGGAAVLTKLSMVPVVLAIAVWLLVLRRPVAALGLLLSATAVSGWWFVRNLLLYGELTGQHAVDRTGVTFEHADLSARQIAQSILTYLTLPTEYVRNVIMAPGLIDGISLAIGLAIVAGAVTFVARRFQMRGSALALVSGVGLASVAAWLLQVVFGQPVAFRTAYGVLPMVALCLGSFTSLILRSAWATFSLALICTLQILTSGWFLMAVSSQAHYLVP